MSEFCADPDCLCTFRRPNRRRLTTDLPRHGIAKGATCVIVHDAPISATVTVNIVSTLGAVLWGGVVVRADQLEPITHRLGDKR